MLEGRKSTLISRTVSRSRTRSGLQRLTQSLFQLPAIGSADSRSRTVFQDHFEFAMGDRLEAQNAFDIDDSGTMDANKTDGIEPFGKLIQRGPVQQLLSSDVQVRVNAGSFDPVDIRHAYEASRTSGFHHQSVQRKIRPGRCGNHAKNAPSKFAHTAFIHPSADPSHGHLKALVLNGFRQLSK